ncbi:MAG TPA: hypothetical protein VGK21_07415, partial [Candidatus Angelobacter sp.]
GSNANSFCTDIGWDSAAGCNAIANCDAAADAERERNTSNRTERDASSCAVHDSNTESDAAVRIGAGEGACGPQYFLNEMELFLNETEAQKLRANG